MIKNFLRIYILLISCLTIYALAEPYIREALSDLFVKQDEGEYAGLFYLMDELYDVAGNDAFLSSMENYPDNQILPTKLLTLDDPELPENIFMGVNTTAIYVADILETIMYARIADSNFVVKVGPLGITPQLNLARLLYKYLLYAVLAFPVFLLVYSLQRKSRMLEEATSHFGKGDFSVRVSEEPRHSTGELNHTFNLMAERVERLMQAHKSLTNAVAHELRTPVSRVRFQLDMLHQETDEQQRIEYIHGMSEDIDELGEMIDELLTYARFDREPVAISMHSHSLHQSIENVIGTRHFDSKLTVNYDDSWFAGKKYTQYAKFDPRNMERAIGNLFSNAEKYATSRIDVRVKRVDDTLMIIIDDDGPGIPVAERNSIFEPFKRVDDSRTRATGGYGLGLAIVKQIAQWHKGQITIGESPEGGARFIFSWPTTG